MPGCGGTCTGPCSTNSAPTASSTGSERLSMGPAFVRNGGSATGSNPVDRGKAGSKLHILTEAGGLSLSVVVSGADIHDMNALRAPVHAILPVRSRRGPRRRRPDRLHAGKAYDYHVQRPWLRDRGITPRIARTGTRLRRYRWRV